jgi:prefoldin subunit 5
MTAITEKIKVYLATWFAGKSMVADILTALNEEKADKEELQKTVQDLKKIVEEVQKSDVTIDTIKKIIEGAKGTEKAISIENFAGFETDVDKKDFFTGKEGEPQIPMQIHPDIKKRIADLESFREELKNKI